MRETQENCIAHQDGQSPEPKRKENFNGSSLGPERIGRQFTWRWERECW